MTVAKPVTAHEMGSAYAAMVREEPGAKRLWVRANDGEVELWLLVDEETDADTERRLYGASLELYNQFDDAAPFVIVVNPSQYKSFVVEHVIPGGAEEISLRPT